MKSGHSWLWVVVVPGAVSLHTAYHCRCLALQCSAQTFCAQPTTATLNWGAVDSASTHGPPARLRCPATTFTLRTLVWGAGREATLRSPPRVSETRPTMKEKRLDFILLPRLYFYFPRIVNELCRLGLCSWLIRIILHQVARILFCEWKTDADAFLFRKLSIVLRINLNILTELSPVPCLTFWPHTYLP